MSDKPVTTVIYHRIDKASMDDYRRWQARITAACSEFEGWQDTEVVEPGIVTPVDNEFVTVFRFDSEELLKRWIDSDVRKKLIKEAEHFTIGKPRVAFLNGLEHWFIKGEGPPRYKMTIVTFFAIWPLVHFLPGPVNQLLNLGSFLNELILTIIIVIVMSYLALPLACRVFRFWLKN